MLTTNMIIFICSLISFVVGIIVGFVYSVSTVRGMNEALVEKVVRMIDMSHIETQRVINQTLKSIIEDMDETVKKQEEKNL